MAVNVGFLGAGYIARTHIENLKRINGVIISCICDVNIEAAQKLLADMGFASGRAYADFDQMIKSEPLDALYICIPPFAHNGQLEKAAAAGIHVFIEKPIAIDSERGQSMVRAVERSGVVSQVGYHMRYGYAVSQLYRMIQDGSAGQPTLFDARYECNSLHSPWWRDKAKSNGQIFEQAIHLYDMAMYLLGKPVKTCGLMGNLCHTDVPGYTIEDTSASCTLFESGAIASICATNCAVPRRWEYPFTVVCAKVTAFFKDANEAEFVYVNDGNPESVAVSGETNMYLEESKAFINAVTGFEPQTCSIGEGLASLLLVESVARSAEHGGMAVSLVLDKY